MNNSSFHHHKSLGCGQSTIPLPENLRKNGFDYTLVLRGERSFIFRQHVTEEVCYYEVFRLKVSKAHNIKDNLIPAKEKFPANEDFGKWAWTYRSYEEALLKFNLLEDEQA